MFEEKEVVVERIVPVWGMLGQHRGADPGHSPQLPVGRPKTLDEVRDLFAKGGLETYEIIQETKRLIKSGAIEMNLKNIAMLAKAEKDCQDVVMTGVDKKNELQNGANKNFVVQILNQIAGQDQEMTNKRLIEDEEQEQSFIELPPAEAQQIARFKALQDATPIPIKTTEQKTESSNP
jgi:hypothetical protein